MGVKCEFFLVRRDVQHPRHQWYYFAEVDFNTGIVRSAVRYDTVSEQHVVNITSSYRLFCSST
jgi:hypothetical protein